MRKNLALILALVVALASLPREALLAATKGAEDDIAVAEGFDPWVTRQSEREEIAGERSYFDCHEDLLAKAEREEGRSFRVPDVLEDVYDREGNALEAEEAVDEGASFEGVRIPGRSAAVFKLDVPRDGSWHLRLRYKVLSDNIVDLKLKVEINGEAPYSEAREVVLPAEWRASEMSDRFNQYGSEIYPGSERVYAVSEHELNHDIFNLNTPLLFEFSEGENELRLTNNELAYELYEITLEPLEEDQSYEDYLAQVEKDQGLAPEFAPAELIILEGEDYDLKNRVHIRGQRSKDFNYHPYDPDLTLINVLAGEMWQNPGDRVSYRFEVAQPGFYRIGFRTQQDLKRDMPVYKNILLDGEAPFEELRSYAFPFTRSEVRTAFLGNDEGDFLIYLSEGEHELSLESTASNFFYAYELLSRVIGTMNQITIDIRTITGNRADEHRDWNIEQYVPGIREDLGYVVDSLNAVYEDLTHLSGQERSSSWNDLRIIADQIELYLNETDGLDRIVNNLDGFSQTDGSMAQQISGLIDRMLEQPLSIDQIYIAGEDTREVPDNLSFLETQRYQLEKFARSFTQQESEDQSLEKDALNIWVNRPLTHLDVLREMINQSYPDPDVKINISAMPDENKLLLSIIGGDVPDGVLGLTSGKPYDFALRGAACDLSQFPDFKDAVSDFTPEMFVPFAHDGGIYGFPETTTFHVLFYRTDIFQSLGLDIPETWQELIDLVPILDRRGMNIQTMIAAADAYKPFGATVPIIQQNHGKIYEDDGLAVAFSDPATLEAFELLTDLYVKYNFPHRIVNFYNNFKSGVTPIGVSELNTYTLLKFAAPEIRGQWAIAPNIGLYDAEGTFTNSQPVVTSSVMITEQSEKKDEMWEFIKWWMDEDTQLQYGNELQMRFGREYIWSSANLRTIARAPYFEEGDRAIILKQIAGAREVPRHPAYFQVERELSDAWNKVVFDGISTREALDSAAISSNRVMRSKLKEFGYIDAEGRVLKTLEMADVDRIRELGNFLDPRRDFPELYVDEGEGEDQ